MSSRLPFTIFQYSSHLEFLQDSYEYFHAEDESFSYDKISELCRLKSRTEAKYLIKGLKRASDAQLQSLAKIFNLNESETKYLICLGQFKEAGGSPAAYALFQKLLELQKQGAPAAEPFREVEIATSVFHMTLLAILDLNDAPQVPSEISKRLKGRYSELEITLALADLFKHGYIARGDNNQMVVAQKHIKKYDYNSNFFLKKFHEDSLKIASDSLHNESTSERYLVGASFCINGKVFQRIVQKMNTFVENLMQLEGVAGDPDTVVQFNQQLIKMTVTEKQIEPVLGHTLTESAHDQNTNSVIVQA